MINTMRSKRDDRSNLILQDRLHIMDGLDDIRTSRMSPTLALRVNGLCGWDIHDMVVFNSWVQG